MQDYYTDDFYKLLRKHSQQAAEEIVPLVLNLISCNYVIDVGCGDGTWLQVFKAHGVKEILGIDGDYVNENTLLLAKENFIAFDLKNPLQINKQFDLVISLEVAEHLPIECAEIFVESLTSLGPVILFSAAIPYQGGNNHINEQWPDYWASLFQERDYVAVDCIRKKIWHKKNIISWYKQNLLIFAKRDYLETNFLLKREFDNSKTTELSWLSIVHPTVYLNTKIALEKATDPEQMSLKKTLVVLPKVIINAFKKQLRLFL
jgi:hypothetical protein